MPAITHRDTRLCAPGGRLLLGISVLARPPLAMLGIGLLVHAQRLTGSFGAAGFAFAGIAGGCAVLVAMASGLPIGQVRRSPDSEL